MTQFPNPLSVPETVAHAREERSKNLFRSIRLGISIRSVIILAEFVGFLFFNSFSLFMDALASTMDIASSAVLLLCIRLAERPPDQDHPFGHGRYEPLAGMLIASFMAFVGGSMVIHQVFQAATESHTRVIDPRTWMIPFVAVILLEICYRFMMRAAEKNQSPALKADAVHFRIDAINSLFAVIVLLSGVYFPYWSLFLDHMGAVLIAVLMIVLGLQASRSNFHQLMDKTPDEKFFNIVRQATKKVPEVRGTEKLRIQYFGPDAHVDIDVEVDPELTVDIAHQISQKVRLEIQKAWPAVRDVIVHIEPYYPDDH